MADKSIVSNSKLNAIADAIIVHDMGRPQMTVDEMATRIAALPVGDADAIVSGSVSEYTASIKHPRNYAFAGCQGLRSATFTASKNLIFGEYCFMQTNALTSLSVPNSNFFVSVGMLKSSGLQVLTGKIYSFSMQGLSYSAVRKIVSTFVSSSAYVHMYDAAFENAMSLKIIDLSAAPQIDAGAFAASYISDLKLVIRDTTRVGILDDLTNMQALSGLKIYVPDSLLNDYKTTATNWVALASQIYPLSEYVE